MSLAAELESTARALVVPGQGLLAADESFLTIEKRFQALGMPSTEENREGYREMLFTTSGLSEFIGDAPWTLTSSYGRALQGAALKTWRGSAANKATAQAALFPRAKCNGLAAQGKYSADLESVVR
ncbi:MAG: class I fructose-bisphosphate aldolase [Chthoniobacterales bacterium]